MRHSGLATAWLVLVAVVGGAFLWAQINGVPRPSEREAVRIALSPLVNVTSSTAPAAAAPSTSAPADPERAKIPAPVPASAMVPGPSPAPENTTASASPRADATAQPVAMQAPPPVETAMIAPAPRTSRETEAPAWLRFGRSFDANDRRPRIAVVMNDLGMSHATTTAAIQKLPGEVTLAFSPYTERLPDWIGQARAAGHEVLLGLPMEPINFPANDPGPRTLLTGLTPRQNLERLEWVLSRATGYVGVTNEMGSRFTAMAEALKPVLTTLNERGLMFLDSRTTTRSVAAKLASEIGLPRAIVDRWIDHEASRDAIDARLAEIERIARETGSAVAMAQPYPVSLERLAAWIPSLESKGFVLSPLTAVVNRQADR
ncbi:MAG TPA: divergent polysaccharide deacetylase family protein [Alphaproteobacteria bacterium]